MKALLVAGVTLLACILVAQCQTGTAQLQASCAKTATLSQAFVDIIVKLGVVNCFTCSQPLAWAVTDENSLPIPVSPVNPLLIGGVAVVEIEGDHLILRDPGAYILPGVSGRRNIICFDNMGNTITARLTSPELIAPLLFPATVIINEFTPLVINCINSVANIVGRVQIFNPAGEMVGFFSYSVPNVTREFAGIYSCVVFSQVSNATKTTTAEVVIQYAPEIVSTNTSSNQIFLSAALHLTCVYVGVPPPDLQLLHNGSIVDTNSTAGVTILGGQEGDNTSSIVIDAVDRDSGGKYTCRATNVLGIAEFVYEVLIVVLPAPEVIGLCTNVVWYVPAVSCEGVQGYDVRLFLNQPQAAHPNVTRRVGSNATFYILQDHDQMGRSLDELFVQVRVIHSNRFGEWSQGISIGCERPTPTPETPTVHFELRGETYFNNSAIPISEIGEGDNAIYCRTDKVDCCGTRPNRFGEFYYPNGVKVPVAARRHGFYRNRGEQIVRLNRREGVSSPTGTYRCEVPNADGDTVKIYITLFSS